MTYRRPIVRPGANAYRSLLDEARADLAQMHFRHQCRLADLHRELEEVRAAFEELKNVVRRRVAAEQELASLRREAELMRALKAERDLATPLN
jgi:hypothetical protein